MIHEKDAIHIMALYHDKPIGVCRLRENEGKIKIERMGIHKNFRNKNIATMMFYFVLGRLQEKKGFEGVGKLFWIGPRSMIKFIQRLGFVPVGEVF